MIANRGALIVVTNTSPLNYLVRLGEAEVLSNLFGEVLAPKAVLEELTHPNAPVDVRRWAITPPSWLRVVEATQFDQTLPATLGIGEQAAISLALHRNADLLLIDDRAGRREAEFREIAAEGTLALLLKAALRKQLDLAESLARLRQFGFRVSPAVVRALLNEQTKPL